MIILGATTFFYFVAVGAASGEIRPVGSVRILVTITWLRLLGPNGVACIGEVLFVLALGVITYYLVKPPLVTKLLPKGVATKSTRR